MGFCGPHISKDEKRLYRLHVVANLSNIDSLPGYVDQKRKTHFRVCII